MISILFLLCCRNIKHNLDMYKEILTYLYHKIKPFLTWRILLCFGMAWMITNGWCYIFIGMGTAFNISWMRNVGLGYLAFLWLPTTPEKLVTFPISIWIHKKLFPKHSVDVLEQRFKIEKEASLQRSKNK